MSAIQMQVGALAPGVGQAGATGGDTEPDRAEAAYKALLTRRRPQGKEGLSHLVLASEKMMSDTMDGLIGREFQLKSAARNGGMLWATGYVTRAYRHPTTALGLVRVQMYPNAAAANGNVHSETLTLETVNDPTKFHLLVNDVPKQEHMFYGSS